MSEATTPAYTFHWLTPERWPDLEALFGPKGAYGGCWCMYWRLPGSAYQRGQGEPNRQAFQRIVADGERPGILAYDGDQPVAWMALAPRGVYGRLSRSKVLAPVDGEEVWSITCFYVAKGHRRKGLTVALLEAAARMAAERGARILEGYPVDPRAGKTADIYAYTGLAGAFQKAGFEEVARRSETRPVMRKRVGE